MTVHGSIRIHLPPTAPAANMPPMAQSEANGGLSDVTALHSCDSARELLTQLDPLNDMWRSQIAYAPRWTTPGSRWLFRGHANSDWQLLPTAHRSAAWINFWDPTKCATWESSEFPGGIPVDSVAERHVLKSFYFELELAALPIPGDCARLRELAENDFIGVEPWIDVDCLPLVALAQHHGLPTRLLDWTRNPRVAIYFAAKAAAQQETSAKELEIWAVNTAALSRFKSSTLRSRAPADSSLKAEISTESSELVLHLVTTTRVNNANLRAQDGLFSVMSGPGARSVDVHIQHCFEKEAPESFVELPMIHRFRAPQAECFDLLGMLADVGINGATMFPGVDGAVEGLRERRAVFSGRFSGR